MRRSTYIVTPLLVAAAITLPMSPMAPTETSAVAHTESSFDTIRHGFGKNFSENPWQWIAGAGIGVAIFAGS